MLGDALLQVISQFGGCRGEPLPRTHGHRLHVRARRRMPPTVERCDDEARPCFAIARNLPPGRISSKNPMVQSGATYRLPCGRHAGALWAWPSGRYACPAGMIRTWLPRSSRFPSRPLTALRRPWAITRVTCCCVNVASKCGLTPQYEALERLYEEFRDRGFAVLGFPANDFAGQEPGSNEEIVEFCTGTYGVQFPLFSKITVTGAGKHPLYAELTSARYPMPTVTRRHFAAICAATG